MGSDSPSLFVCGCNHKSTPLEVRERLALSTEGVSLLQQKLSDLPFVNEHVVLNTCNRVEVYASGDAEKLIDALDTAICEINGASLGEWQNHAYHLADEHVIQHAFKVASGLDSQLIGETEILGQIKSAYDSACSQKSAGTALHKLFQKSFQAAKWARTHTAIGQGQVSLGNVAVDLAQRIFGNLSKSRIIVLGSGDVGRDVAKAFRSRGVDSIKIASRTAAKAEDLARQVSGEVIPFVNWQDELPFCDIAILATSAPGHILSLNAAKKAMYQHPASPVFLIDLAIPRDIDPAVSELQNLFLYNLDDLTSIANENLKARKAEMNKCLQILNEKAAYLAKSMQLKKKN